MRLPRLNIMLLTLIIASGNLLYGTGYNINVRIGGLSDTTLLLAYHFGNRKYIKDTIRVDHSGWGVFRDNEALPGGIYLVVTPDMNYFELLIDREQNFTVETTMENPVANMKITGSVENEQFIDYHRFMNRQQEASARLRERLQASSNNSDSAAYLQALGRNLDKEVQDYWDSLVRNNPGTLLANLIRAMRNPQVPEFEIPAGSNNPDSLRWVMGYEYNRNHFFDNLDFSDERLLRTPVLHNKLEHFFTRVLIQSPDSIIPQAVRVIEYSKSNDRVFQYVTVYLLNHFERSTIMGHDEIFVELAERYYLSGEAFWAGEEMIEKLRDRVARIKPNLIGRTAVEMRMTTPEGDIVSLHNTDAEYIVLYFYEPACGHCRTVTPRLNGLARKYEDRGLKVFGIYIYDDAEEWTSYIKENNLEWINVYDPLNRSGFRFYYDIYSTPTLYILDSEKTIIAKRVGIETIEQILEERL